MHHHYVAETSEEFWPVIPPKHILLTRINLCCCLLNQNFVMNIFSMRWDAVQFTGRSSVHYGVGPGTVFCN